jgi:hypothetical protein
MKHCTPVQGGANSTPKGGGLRAGELGQRAIRRLDVRAQHRACHPLDDPGHGRERVRDWLQPSPVMPTTPQRAQRCAHKE